MIQAILYTSNSGYTEEYAKLLSEKTGIEAWPLSKAVHRVDPGAQVICMGRLMAGVVKGYKDAAKNYDVLAVCAVGMGATGSQLDETRKSNKIPASTALFTLQGGFDINKLHGIYKFMMETMKNTVGKKLAKKKDRTADEDDMLDMMMNGGDRVTEENLTKVLEWLEQQRRTDTASHIAGAHNY